MRYPTTSEAIALIVLLLIALSIYKAQRSEGNTFNLLDLLMENGKVSKISCIVMGSWAALTYTFLGMYSDGKMTEGLMMAYGGLCFAPMIARMFSFAPVQAAPTTDTSK